MIIMIHHIEYLLTKHECICIPGLGGFMSAYKEAQFIATDIITPPSKCIRFNESLNYNDGLIVNSIMKERNISFEDASVLLNTEIRLLKSQLNNGETVEFGSIGILYKNSNNNIEFKNRSVDVNFDLSLYGFNEVRFNRIITPESKPASDRENIITELGRNNLKQLKRIASFAALIILFLSISLPANKSVSLQNKASIISSKLISELISPDYNYYKPNISEFTECADVVYNDSLEISEISNNTDISLLQEVKDQGNIPIKRYYIIIASFPDNDKAINYIKKLENKGYNNVSVLEKGGKFRLYIDCFEDKTKAVDYLEDFRETSNMNDAWLLAHIS